MTAETRRQTIKAIQEHSVFIVRWEKQESNRPEWLRSATTAARIVAYRAKVAELWARLAADETSSTFSWTPEA